MVTNDEPDLFLEPVTFVEGDAFCIRCTICIEDYERGEILRRIRNCVHVFHMHCIMNWLDANTCPVCRALINPNTRVLVPIPPPRRRSDHWEPFSVDILLHSIDILTIRLITRSGVHYTFYVDMNSVLNNWNTMPPILSPILPLILPITYSAEINEVIESFDSSEDVEEFFDSFENVEEFFDSSEDVEEFFDSSEDVEEPLHANEDVEEPLHANEDVEEQLHANENVEQPLHANEDVEEPLHANEDVEEPLHANEDVEEPLHANEDVEEPLHANEDVEEPLHANENVEEPLDSNEDIRAIRCK